MGSDMLYMHEEQARVRSQFAQKVSGRIKLEIIYKPMEMNIPIEEMTNMYSGTVKFIDVKAVEHIIGVPKYEDAVLLYKFVQGLKRDLS